MNRQIVKRKTLKLVEGKFQEFIREELGIQEPSKQLSPKLRLLKPAIEVEVNLVTFVIL